MIIPLPSIIYLPGEEGWERWKRAHDGNWQITESEVLKHKSVQAVPMLSLVSSPFSALKAQEADDALLASTVQLRWDTLGFETEGPGKHWISWIITENDPFVLMGTMALSESTFTDSILEQRDRIFEPSVGFYPLSHDSISLWKELGRFVVAFQQGGKLLHASTLSARELDASAAAEIRDLAQILAVTWPYNKWSIVCLWTEVSSEFIVAMEGTFAVPVCIEDKPAPQLPLIPSGLLPSLVAIKRQARKQQRRQLLFLFSFISLLVVGFSAWASWLGVKEKRVNQSFEQINALHPKVEEVQRAQLKWWALEQAINQDKYPIEVFRQIVSLLPPEGIRFKEFKMDSEKLIISGEASSLIHASKFQSDLKANIALQRFSLNAPQPTILDDNRANFRIEGTTKTGGLDEAK